VVAFDTDRDGSPFDDEDCEAIRNEPNRTSVPHEDRTSRLTDATGLQSRVVLHEVGHGIGRDLDDVFRLAFDE